MLYWQLYSNLSDSLICWHNEIAAYLIYHIIFSCHLLLYKNKLSCLQPWQPSEDQSRFPCPTWARVFFCPPKSDPLLQLHMDCHLSHGRLACKTLWLLPITLPLSFPPVALQGTLDATTAQPCHLGSHPRLCWAPVLVCGPSSAATSGWVTASALLSTHVVKLAGARPGQSAAGPWGWHQAGGAEIRATLHHRNLLQPGQAPSPAPGAAWSPPEVQVGSHGNKRQLGHMHEHSLRCICCSAIWLSHRNTAIWLTHRSTAADPSSAENAVQQ